MHAADDLVEKLDLLPTHVSDVFVLCTEHTRFDCLSDPSTEFVREALVVDDGWERDED